MSYSSDANASRPVSTTVRLKEAFLKSFPYSATLAVVVCIAICAFESSVPPDAAPASVLAGAMGATFEHEQGDLIPTEVPSGTVWTVDYHPALEEYSRLLNISRIVKVLDVEDFANLTDTLKKGRAIDELKSVVERMDNVAESHEDPQIIINDLAKALTNISGQLRERSRLGSSSQATPPLILRLEPIAKEAVETLEKRVDKLRALAGWHSADRPIGYDLQQDPKRRDELIESCHAACRDGRAAFVFVLCMLSDRSGKAEDLAARLETAETIARSITLKLADDPSLAEAGCEVVPEKLRGFVTSMDYRLSELKKSLGQPMAAPRAG